MSSMLPFEVAFVEELNGLGVRIGIVPVETAAREFFRRGIDFCVRHPVLLRQIIKDYVPDHDAYRRLIKGSVYEKHGASREKRGWRQLSDGYNLLLRTERNQTKRAVNDVSAVLADFSRSKDNSHVRRIILCIGAAACWGPTNPPELTPVGELLAAIWGVMNETPLPPAESKAA